MYPSAATKQSGSMLVIAIFTLVVLSLLGLAMIRLTATASNTVVTEVYGLRAYNAANTGLEVMLMQEFPHGGGAGDCEDLASDTLAEVSLNSISGLENCSYTVQCRNSAENVVIAGVSRDLILFHSVGKCTVGDFIASRTITIEAVRSN